MSNIGKRLASWDIVFFSIGVFCCYIPQYILTRMASKGLFASFEGMIFSSFEILPFYALGNIIANLLFFTFSGWWREIPFTKKFGLALPKIRWYIVVSGMCTIGQVFTAIWAYSFTGISIVFAALLMKGGVLCLAPIVDLLAKKRKRKIYWPSWIAGGLSLFALIIASSGKASSTITTICIIDIALYLFVHAIKLTIMSRWAKSRDTTERRQYIIEEQIVITIGLNMTLAAMGLVGSGTESGSVFNQVWKGYAYLPSIGFIFQPLFIGISACGLGICQSLLYLDRRENTFCAAAIQSSGILSGAFVTILLSRFYSQPAIETNKIISVIIVISAIIFLAYRGIVEKRRVVGKTGSIMLLE